MWSGTPLHSLAVKRSTFVTFCYSSKGVKSSSPGITWVEIIDPRGDLPQWCNSPGSGRPLSQPALHRHHFSERFGGVKAHWGIVLHPLARWRHCRWCGGGRGFDRGPEQLWIFFRNLEEIPFRGLSLPGKVIRHLLHHLSFLPKMFRPGHLFRFFYLLEKRRRGEDRWIEKTARIKGWACFVLDFRGFWLLSFWLADFLSVALGVYLTLEGSRQLSGGTIEE